MTLLDIRIASLFGKKIKMSNTVSLRVYPTQPIYPSLLSLDKNNCLIFKMLNNEKKSDFDALCSGLLNGSLYKRTSRRDNYNELSNVAMRRPLDAGGWIF
jgi:hypothetical protein